MRKVMIGLVLFLGFASNAMASIGTYHIADDATGGDCTSIGTWDVLSKTCTLTTDLNFAYPNLNGIGINSGNITLDGNGHTISGDGMGLGVDIWGHANVVVKNLNINYFHNGFVLEGSSDITLMNNTINFCNGYDLTIDIASAQYTTKKDRLAVEATSAYAQTANLSLVGYGPMTWVGNKWAITIEPAGGNPSTVTVTGAEGSESSPVSVR